MIVEALRLKSAGRMAGWRLREELILQLESEGSLLAEFPVLQGKLVFFLRPSTDWMRPLHTMEG